MIVDVKSRDGFGSLFRGLTAVVSLAAVPAFADCIADKGTPELIETNGVTVICDTNDPNPYLDGIGSQGTSTGLTVEVEEDVARRGLGEPTQADRLGRLVLGPTRLWLGQELDQRCLGGRRALYPRLVMDSLVAFG